MWARAKRPRVSTQQSTGQPSLLRGARLTRVSTAFLRPRASEAEYFGKVAHEHSRGALNLARPPPLPSERQRQASTQQQRAARMLLDPAPSCASTASFRISGLPLRHESLGACLFHHPIPCRRRTSPRGLSQLGRSPARIHRGGV